MTVTGNPLVSVIMPLYNKRPYVRRAIESVQKQTYSYWELIIVDDGSTDGSSELVPRDDERIKLFRQENRGAGAARNRAVEMSSGDYIAFIDADDYYYPFKLKKGMEFLYREQKAEWMVSAYDHDITGMVKTYYIKDINNKEIRDETLVFDNALNQLQVSGWPSDGLFVKRALFDRLRGFNEEMRFCEISEFIIRCAAMQPRIVICHIPLYFIMLDVNGSTSKAFSPRRDYFEILGKTFYSLSKEYPEYAGVFTKRGRDYMTAYGAWLLLEGRMKAGRQFLLKDFLYTRNRRWWKLLAGSCLPVWLLNRLVSRNLIQGV